MPKAQRQTSTALHLVIGGMRRFSARRAFEGLRVVGLAVEHSHVVEGPLVRIHFRLSAQPPLGWSYIFTTVWKAAQYPEKRRAAVQGDLVWLECIPQELTESHIAQLENAVAQTNTEYQASTQQQTLKAGHHAQLNAQLQSELEALSRTHFPSPAPTVKASFGQFWGRRIITYLKWFFRGNSKGKL